MVMKEKDDRFAGICDGELSEEKAEDEEKKRILLGEGKHSKGISETKKLNLVPNIGSVGDVASVLANDTVGYQSNILSGEQGLSQ